LSQREVVALKTIKGLFNPWNNFRKFLPKFSPKFLKEKTVYKACTTNNYVVFWEYKRPIN